MRLLTYYASLQLNMKGSTLYMRQISLDKYAGRYHWSHTHLSIQTLVCRKQSTTPALASIMRGRRIQFLPVQWRANLKLDVDEERRREDAGLDNEFTLNGMKNITSSALYNYQHYHRYHN